MPAQVRWVHAVIRPAGERVGKERVSATLPLTSFNAPGYKVSEELGVWEELVEVPANTFQNRHNLCTMHVHWKMSIVQYLF